MQHLLDARLVPGVRVGGDDRIAKRPWRVEMLGRTEEGKARRMHDPAAVFLGRGDHIARSADIDLLGHDRVAIASRGNDCGEVDDHVAARRSPADVVRVADVTPDRGGTRSLRPSSVRLGRQVETDEVVTAAGDLGLDTRAHVAERAGEQHLHGRCSSLDAAAGSEIPIRTHAVTKPGWHNSRRCWSTSLDNQLGFEARCTVEVPPSRFPTSQSHAGHRPNHVIGRLRRVATLSCRRCREKPYKIRDLC